MRARSCVGSARPSSRRSIRSTGRVTAGTSGCGSRPRSAAMKEFFARWREESAAIARKYAVACRDYVMAKIAYLSGVRAAELCGVCIGDVHWESGQWGRFLVQGKGARGSGPRPREAYLFEEGRELLWWYIEEVRGEFGDDAEHPRAPLLPSERMPKAVAALNVPIAPAIVPVDVPAGAAHRGARLPARAGHRPVPAPAAARLRDPQLRARDDACGRCRSCSDTTGRPRRLRTWRPLTPIRSTRAWRPAPGRPSDW